jgi:MobA/MobL family
MSKSIQNHLRIRVVRRSKGRTGASTYAASYRAGETISDERTGDLYKHVRTDVKHKEILLPTSVADKAELQWARDRAKLWNTVERSERKSNSRVAREYTVVLPSELAADQRLTLVRGFAQAISDRYQNVVDIAIHEPRRGRAVNHHAHLLSTTREITASGLGRKTMIENSRLPTKTENFNSIRRQYKEIRALWTEHLDRTLQNAGIQRDTYVFKPGRGAAETSPQSWSEFNESLFLDRFFAKLQARRDAELNRLTPAERAMVKENKKQIRLKREMELADRKEKRVEGIRARMAARTPEQVEERNRVARERHRELPQERKEQLNQAKRAAWKKHGKARNQELREARKARTPEQIAADSQKAREKYEQEDPERRRLRQQEYHRKNAEALRAKARERYWNNREARLTQVREYAAQNRDLIRQRQHISYHEHIEDRRLRDRARYPERQKQRGRQREARQREGEHKAPPDSPETTATKPPPGQEKIQEAQKIREAVVKEWEKLKDTNEQTVDRDNKRSRRRDDDFAL